MSAQKNALTMAEVVQDPEGAVLAIRRAQIAQWHAESRAEQFELILSAFDALRRGDWAPSEYSAQWRSRAEAAEAKLAALSTPPADDVREALTAVLVEWSEGGVYTGHEQRQADAILSDPRFEVRPRGKVTDAEVEAGARALAGLAPGEEWPSNDPRDDEYRDTLRDIARDVLAAAREVQP